MQSSTNSSQYTLHVSNERVEKALGDEERSSASNFHIPIIPSLDLSALRYLTSSECELRLAKLEIDSYPLSFIHGESIKTFLNIPTNLAGGNSFFNVKTLETKNNQPLEIKIGDFQSNNPNKWLEHANVLLANSNIVYIIRRYSELLLDNNSIFSEE